jgi:hypothetical protein
VVRVLSADGSLLRRSHPERSRFSGGAKDLACRPATVFHEIRHPAEPCRNSGRRAETVDPFLGGSHPERSRFSGGAKDLACRLATVFPRGPSPGRTLPEFGTTRRNRGSVPPGSHPERSRFSGGAKDLACRLATVFHEIRHPAEPCRNSGRRAETVDPFSGGVILSVAAFQAERRIWRADRQQISHVIPPG